VPYAVQSAITATAELLVENVLVFVDNKTCFIYRALVRIIYYHGNFLIPDTTMRMISCMIVRENTRL